MASSVFGGPPPRMLTAVTPRGARYTPTSATVPCTFGISGFHTVAGATSYPIASFRGPTRRSYTAAILCRQFPAASAKSFPVISTCTNFSACTNVSTDTSGPEHRRSPKRPRRPWRIRNLRPQRNLRHLPRSAACSPPPATDPATTAATNPIEPFAKNSRRERAIPTLRQPHHQRNRAARYITPPPHPLHPTRRIHPHPPLAASPPK